MTNNVTDQNDSVVARKCRRFRTRERRPEVRQRLPVHRIEGSCRVDTHPSNDRDVAVRGLPSVTGWSSRIHDGVLRQR
jgi:hypothetical protein